MAYASEDLIREHEGILFGMEILEKEAFGRTAGGAAPGITEQAGGGD